MELPRICLLMLRRSFASLRMTNKKFSFPFGWMTKKKFCFPFGWITKTNAVILSVAKDDKHKALISLRLDHKNKRCHPERSEGWQTQSSDFPSAGSQKQTLSS